RFARNDGESCHCEPRSGEAIQRARTANRLKAPLRGENVSLLDCFASLAMTGGRLLAMTIPRPGLGVLVFVLNSKR
ncbi:MAG: hypothetical protein LBT00_07170, partial [Spirochaetaceae bacterium]|nr:hypothetical protein [Spirochaetaceae bacterium]